MKTCESPRAFPFPHPRTFPVVSSKKKQKTIDRDNPLCVQRINVLHFSISFEKRGKMPVSSGVNTSGNQPSAHNSPVSKLCFSCYLGLCTRERLLVTVKKSFRMRLFSLSRDSRRAFLCIFKKSSCRPNLSLAVYARSCLFIYIRNGLAPI